MIDFKISETDGSVMLSVEGELSIEKAAGFTEALTASINQGDRILVDLTGVAGISLPCLQLLCSAHKTAASRNKRLTIIGLTAGGAGAAAGEAGFFRRKGCPADRDNTCLWLGGGA